MLCRADSVGVFQVESRAQMATLPRLRPETFYDLVVEVALIRPGPIQGGSVHPYIRRRKGLEEPTYLHPLLEPALEKTLGVPLFQEQLMQMAIDVAGFTPGEADELRQAMGSKRSHERMERLRQRLYDGMAANGVTGEVADRIWEKLAAFASYGFPESHSVSFAYLVYASSWLKRYYPAAFCAALLDAQPMGFYSPHSLTQDARRHGVEVRTPDLAVSAAGATLEVDGRPSRPPVAGGGGGARLGERGERGRPGAGAGGGWGWGRCGAWATSWPGASWPSGDAGGRLRPPGGPGAPGARPVVAQLEAWPPRGRSGASGSTGAGPCGWRGRWPRRAPTGSTASSPGSTPPAAGPRAHRRGPGRPVGHRRQPRGPPTRFVRDLLDDLGVVPAAGLVEREHGSRVTVGGVVTHRQRPATAGGTTFVNLEDETGLLNIVVSKGCWAHHRRVVRTAAALLVRGRLERVEGVTNVIAGPPPTGRRGGGGGGGGGGHQSNGSPASSGRPALAASTNRCRRPARKPGLHQRTA